MKASQWRTVLPLPDDVPAYRGLAEAIRGLAMEGALSNGDRLPSERQLGELLGLSRTTITRTYGDLVETGWAEARQGSGTRIVLPEGARAPSMPLVPGRHSDVIDLSAAAGWAPPGTAELIQRALEWLPSTLRGAGYETIGAGHLRERIAAWYADRGAPTTPEQIVVTPGAQAALNVALHTLIGPNRQVAVDSPTYPGALAAITAAGGQPVSIPLHQGWDVDAWAAALRRTGARTAYLIADFHNPTGLVMPPDQRSGLVHLLRAHRCRAVVDESLIDLWFDQPPGPAWAAGDGAALTTGSLSKSLWGGVRVGWLRCPPELIDRVRATALQLSLGASAIDQLIATTFFDHGEPLRDSVRQRLRLARESWTAELGRVLPSWRVNHPSGGLALWVTLPERLASELAQAAWQHRLLLPAGPTFSADRTLRHRIRLPLTLPLEAIPETVQRLAAAWSDVGLGRNAGQPPQRVTV